MTVPVTYRYYIRLYDTWELHIGGSTLIALDSTHSIQINGVAPSSLGAPNFVIK